MSGVCGIAHADRSKRVDRSRLRAMNKALQHRGRFRLVVWRARRARDAPQSVIDSRQATVRERRRIDRPRLQRGDLQLPGLRHDLEQRGHVFRTPSDTEVVLWAYEEHGDDALLRLNGMFAFALYDARHDRVLIARDRAGIKPLFYACHEGTLIFASELDAVLRSGLVRGALNPSAMEAYFSFLYVPSPDTIYRDVQKLMPAHKLVFQRGDLRVERHVTALGAPRQAVVDRRHGALEGRGRAVV